MTDQETACVAALAVRARSPDTGTPTDYGCQFGLKPSVSEHHLALPGVDRAPRPAPKIKKNVLKGPLMIPTEKLEVTQENLNGISNNDGADDLTDIIISDEVLKQLRSHTDKKSSKQRRKAAKILSKSVKLTEASRKEEPDVVVKVPAKRTLKPTLRRKGSMLSSKSQVIERTDSMELRGRREERNKADNNSWIVNDNTAMILQGSRAATDLSGKSPSSLVDGLVRASESTCRACLARNCTPGSCTAVKAAVDSADKEYSFKRADSSDDSGCFSNQSLQSINSPGSQIPEANIDLFPVNEGSVVQTNYASLNSKKRFYNSGLCSACGNEPQGNGSALCKTCIGRIRNDGMRIGALGELRAYAQSIADSVKKILSISPRESEEGLYQLPESRDKNTHDNLKRENAVNVPNIPGGYLQKCKTQISMTVGDDLRPKSLLNKSISFDGRAAALVEENSRGSPMYWITQDKSKLPLPAPAFCESEEDKLLRGLDHNGGDQSVLEGDYFAFSGKDVKQYTGHEDDKNSKMDKMERLNKKNYTKQVSCVDRIRTEVGIRGNSFQQGTPDRKSESKRLSDFQRSRSKISRSANMEADGYSKHSQKHEDEIKALNVFRLKVIHEGSPVDPLYTVQKVRGGEDSKDRRAALMRSATAPNKNHMPKKANTAEDKAAMMKHAVKTQKSSTKLSIHAIRSPMFTREESMSETEEETKQTACEPKPDSWRDDASVTAVTPFNRRRSTSYDGRKPKSSKRNELHKSISRSGVERDVAGNKQRRKTPSKELASTRQRVSGNDPGYASKLWHPLRSQTNWADEGRPTGVPVPVTGSRSREPLSDMTRYHSSDSRGKEFSQHDVNDRAIRAPIDDSSIQMLESPGTPDYFEDVKYYQRATDVGISPPAPKELVYISDRSAFDTNSYYCETEVSSIDDGIVADKSEDFDVADDHSVYTGVEGEDTYHNAMEPYSAGSISPEKGSVWYSSHLDRRALKARDRSHESKSSTSFHIVTNTKSSHSDVALMKYQAGWDHTTSRRQSMYSETDVDTGLIYHFAKRQTTRAHVPAYHDLTSASKDIYTMSGDVSTSASSNSAISSKSEVSDCVYTGGFFKHDPFYDNDSKISSSNSSADSSSHLYFEPNSGTKREPSELDIYTGAIFSSSQNALSLGRATEMNAEGQLHEALQDGSTNNSTRPVGGRMSRRLRYRPHIDVIKFKSTDSVNEFLSKSMEANSDILMCNISNNSCSWCALDEPEEMESQGAVVRLSHEPLYTDYAMGMKPVFNPRKVEKPAPTVDLLKYERQDNSANNVFFTTPAGEGGSDSEWYSGFNKHRKMESEAKQAASRTKSYMQCTFQWQHSDDYYTSAQRPRPDKSNNNTNNNNSSSNNGCTRNDLQGTVGDRNNNRLDDIYTGFFESPKDRSYSPEQQRSRRTSSDSWYADQPRRSHSGFYSEDRGTPETAGRAFATEYEASDGTYSSPSVFTQAREAYAGTSSYMAGSGWKEYDRNQSSPHGSYVEEDEDEESVRARPVKTSSYSDVDKYSYFPDGSGPADADYLYDSEKYGYDKRSPSPKSSSSQEIKKVGGIVCRDNVANQEDYAEDVNRDLEQGIWAPYNFRHEDKARHSEEASGSRSEPVSEVHKTAPVGGGSGSGSSGGGGSEKRLKHYDDSIYNQNRLYDSGGDRKKWRETSVTKKAVSGLKKEPSPHRANPAGDAKKPVDYVKSAVWNPPDQIPDKARGKRSQSSTSKTPACDGSKSSSTTSHVISSVTSLPSRFTNYVKKWL